MISARLITAMASFSLLAACSFSPEETLSDINSMVGLSSAPAATMRGLVVGDEPFAVRAGAAVLAEGGSAADAATAIYFSLAVTYPVAAGLGGGGICIAHDSRTGVTREFDFLARDAAGRGNFAVPGNVRGFEALQSTYGKLAWRRVIAPAESLAGAGFPISRALFLRLTAAQEAIKADPELSAQFLNSSGEIKSAGEIVYNRGLAETLGAVRLGGANAFYSGPRAEMLVTFAAAQGSALNAQDLAAYRISLSTPRSFRIGSLTALLPPARVGAGAFSGAMIDNMNRAIATEANLETATATAVKAALNDFSITALPVDLGSTGFSVIDANGQAVTCAVTMNGGFGSGRTATATGVTFARAPANDPAGLAAAFLTPMLVLDGGGTITLSGAASGGPNGTAAITLALYRMANGNLMTRPGDIRSTGVAPYEMVNAIVCQGGTCAALPDPGGSGVGVSADAID